MFTKFKTRHIYTKLDDMNYTEPNTPQHARKRPKDPTTTEDSSLTHTPE